MAAAPKRSRSEAEYEDYDSTSQTYDTVRRCVGLDSLERALQRSSKGVGKPLSELQLLDTGCGTGNYIAAVKNRVASCVGLDPNAGMVKQARTKHGDDRRVTLQQASVLEIPFPDSSFDVVIMTQVLHHLTPDTHAAALSEIVRVLRPGGTFWISTQTPHQHMEGFWWAPIIPQVKPAQSVNSTPWPSSHTSHCLHSSKRVSCAWQAAATLAARFPGQPQFIAQLQEAGLSEVVWEVPDESLVAKEAYVHSYLPDLACTRSLGSSTSFPPCFVLSILLYLDGRYTDVNGPLAAVYRNGDSTWSLATEAELAAGLTWWKAEIAAGRAQAFLSAREQRRKEVGQTSAVCAQKPI